MTNQMAMKKDSSICPGPGVLECMANKYWIDMTPEKEEEYRKKFSTLLLRRYTPHAWFGESESGAFFRDMVTEALRRNNKQ